MHIFQGTRKIRSAKQTIKRLEDAAVFYRGPERVQLLKRWLAVLKDIEELEKVEDTLEHYLASGDLMDSPKSPSLVSKCSFFHSEFLLLL